MATQEERKDIQQLKTDVALIKQEQRNQTATLVGINQKLETLAFVYQKDYDDDQERVWAAIRKLETDRDEDRKLINAGGLKIANALNSNVTKIIIGALAFGLVALIVWSLAKVSPAIGGL